MYSLQYVLIRLYCCSSMWKFTEKVVIFGKDINTINFVCHPKHFWIIKPVYYICLPCLYRTYRGMGGGIFVRSHRSQLDAKPSITPYLLLNNKNPSWINFTLRNHFLFLELLPIIPYNTPCSYFIIFLCLTEFVYFLFYLFFVNKIEDDQKWKKKLKNLNLNLSTTDNCRMYNTIYNVDTQII